jgi:hypothetical protein
MQISRRTLAILPSAGLPSVAQAAAFIAVNGPWAVYTEVVDTLPHRLQIIAVQSFMIWPFSMLLNQHLAFSLPLLFISIVRPCSPLCSMMQTSSRPSFLAWASWPIAMHILTRPRASRRPRHQLFRVPCRVETRAASQGPRVSIARRDMSGAGWSHRV